MSFQGDVARFSEQLRRLVDAKVPVKDAAQAIGIDRQKAYAILRSVGQPAGQARGKQRSADAELIRSVYADTGSVNQARIAAGVAFSVARRILVEAGSIEAGVIRRGKPEAKQRFLELITSGWSVSRAAREVGVNERTGEDWRAGIRRSGNMRIHPDGTVVDYATGARYTISVAKTCASASISERYLSIDDRLAIADGLVNKLAQKAIAERIGKHPSTVSREVKAHSIDGIYLPYRANEQAAVSRERPKQSKLVINQALRAAVEKGLEQLFSPEQIAHRLRKDFPDDESMRVSHETIYQALYFQARGGLKQEVLHSLRSNRTRRKPQRKPGERQPRFVDDMIMISDRPAEVEDRAVPGHWEGDLIMGAGNLSAIGTLVERTTRYTLLVHLPGNHEAETVRDGLIKTMSTLPAHLRGSLTWDQGCEMARHKQFTIATDMQVYFCNPHSPWERGSNENTNGLLRQYFPKGTDLSVYGPEDLEHVSQQLNKRPRKTLDWDTPAERLRDLLTA